MNLAHDQRVHWVAVLLDLRRAVWSDHAIADRIGATDQRVRKWREISTQPRHDDGERLIALWCEVMHRRRDQVPIIRACEDYEP